MPLSTLLREFWRGVTRNRSAFVMSITVQGVALLLFTLFGVITINLINVLTVARNRVEVYAFISDDASPVDLASSLKMISGVVDVRYVTKDEALQELKQDLGENSSIVDVLGRNPLPASLRVKLAPGYARAKNLDAIERKVSAMPGVVEVWSGRELLEKLETILSTALIVDIVLLVVIAFCVLFVIFQTVETTIATRSREIEIMRLVGATSATVKGPFYAEGIFQGLAGGVVSFILSVIIYEVAIALIPQPTFPVLGVFLFDAILGGVLGYMGADIALSRLVK
jgi:cell division transport system permease protein